VIAKLITEPIDIKCEKFKFLTKDGRKYKFRRFSNTQLFKELETLILKLIKTSVQKSYAFSTPLITQEAE